METRVVEKNDGTIVYPVRVRDGVIHGQIVKYYPNGKVFKTLDVVNGYPSGPRRTYGLKGLVAETGVKVMEPMTFNSPLFYLSGEYIFYNERDGSVREVGRNENGIRIVEIENGILLEEPKKYLLSDDDVIVDELSPKEGEEGPGFSSYRSKYNSQLNGRRVDTRLQGGGVTQRYNPWK